MKIDLGTVGKKATIDVQRVSRIAFQSTTTTGSSSTAVLEVKRAFAHDSPSVSFPTQQTITLDGSEINEIDVTDTAWLHLVCTTAESGIRIELEHIMSGDIEGLSYTVELDVTSEGVRGEFSPMGAYRTFVLTEALGPANTSSVELQRIIGHSSQSLSFSTAVNLVADSETITEINTKNTETIRAICGTSQASQRLKMWVYQRGETMGSEPEDFLIEAAVNRRSGYLTNRKFGRNTDIDTGSTPEDIWFGSGLYTGFPAVGGEETVDVVSTSANDTSGGTGARQVLLSGLDANFVEQEEYVTLNGTTPVTSTNTWIRLNRARVTDAGSGETNAGVISVTHTTTSANKFVEIEAGGGQSTVLVYTVPANKKMLISSIDLAVARSSGSSAEISATLRVRDNDLAAVVRAIDYFYVNQGTPLEVLYPSYEAIDEKTDVWIRVDSVATNNTAVTGSIHYILTPK